MCHHGDAFEERLRAVEGDAEETDEAERDPSFANEERDVDVALLDADDD